jgi:ABC-type multidrug transport system ATPase subunit
MPVFGRPKWCNFLTMHTPPIVLDIDNLCFAFSQHSLFTNLSAQIPPGVSLICGGDGTGKTTLLQLLAGAIPLQNGSLRINGVSVHEQASTYRSHVFWIDPRTTANDQVSATAYFKTLPASYPLFDKQALATVIDGLSLAPHIDKPMYMLSTGSRRKVWIAAALAAGATITLLDEPFAALDKPSINFLLDCLSDASSHQSRSWILAAYEPPGQVPLACVIDLGD